MNIKEKTICFSGHRSNRLPRAEEEMENLKVLLYEEIDRAVKDGFDTFLFGACYGFDLICAEMTILRKMVIRLGSPKQIKLIAVVPFEEQAAKWTVRDRDAYNKTLLHCDDVITLSAKYTKHCYNKRNQYMVDNSKRLICYYDGGSGGTANTVHYAKQCGLDIINLFK